MNAQSIVNKTDWFELVLLNHDPHVTVITETWLNKNVSDNEFFPESHQVFRRDRPSRGGGIAVVIKSSICVTTLEQISNHESLILRLDIWGRKVLLCAVYRPPSASPDYLNRLYDYLIKYKGESILLVGDFNLPHVDWLRLSSPCDDEIIFDIMFACDLSQVVKEFTREQGSSRSILDLIFVSSAFADYSVRLEESKSDHKLVLFDCYLNRPSPKKKSSYYGKGFFEV